MPACMHPWRRIEHGRESFNGKEGNRTRIPVQLLGGAQALGSRLSTPSWLQAFMQVFNTRLHRSSLVEGEIDRLLLRRYNVLVSHV